MINIKNYKPTRNRKDFKDYLRSRHRSLGVSSVRSTQIVLRTYRNLALVSS